MSTHETTTAGSGDSGTGRGLVFYTLRAEGVGFEPTNKDHLLAVFKSACSSALTRPLTRDRPDFSSYLSRSTFAGPVHVRDATRLLYLSGPAREYTKQPKRVRSIA
jgi:hypothetical protein